MNITITFQAQTVEELTSAIKAVQSLGVNPSVSTPKPSRFRMNKEQAIQWKALPEDQREAFRLECMNKAGFTASDEPEVASVPEDDGRDVLA